MTDACLLQKCCTKATSPPPWSRFPTIRPSLLQLRAMATKHNEQNGNNNHFLLLHLYFLQFTMFLHLHETNFHFCRMRTSFKHHQLRTMKTYFAINQNPDAKDLKQLAQKTGLSKRVLQVNTSADCSEAFSEHKFF